MVEEGKVERRDGLHGAGLRRAMTAVLCFYILLLLLNVGALHESIERQPFGPARTFWLRVTGPLARVTDAVGLDRPRELIKAKMKARLAGNSH